jgi:DNA-binding response OmpR family regulator
MIDESTQPVRLRGRALGMSWWKFRLLNILTQWPEAVYPLRAAAPGAGEGEEVGVTLRTVDVHIRRVRSKLGPYYAGFIVTVRKVGYQVVELDRQAWRGPTSSASVGQGRPL